MISGPARAQWTVFDPSNLAQSIVNSSKELVETSTTAQNMIKNFEETAKIYNQWKGYYDKLRNVSNYIRGGQKVLDCVGMVQEISGMYVDNFKRMLRDGNFDQNELSLIAKGYTRLLEKSTLALREVQTITTPGEVSMTDKERLDIVQRQYESLCELRRRTIYFTGRNLAIARERAQKAQDIKHFLSLYGSDDEKYQ